jgi:hypothetical protein
LAREAGLLIADPTCQGWHLISTEGAQLLAKHAAGIARRATTQVESSSSNNGNSKSNKEEPFRFQIALSFPGQYRTRVEKIASGRVKTIGQKKVLYEK